jgi:lysine-N-methylase
MSLPIRKHLALRYMTGFECLGSACEDDCCSGWSIDVDRDHFDKIGRMLEADPAERERFLAAAEIRPEPERTRGRFAILRVALEASCLFLDSERLCSLQKRFGQRVLPDICASYPRIVSVLGERVELGGELSCPEVARRCLLDPHGTDVVEVTPDQMGRGTLRQQIVGESEDPYLTHLDEVRAAMLRLGERVEYPLASRLYFVFAFGKRSSEFFFQSTPVFDRARLSAELARLEDLRVLDELHRERLALPPDGVVAASVVAKMLARRLEQRCTPAFRRLVAGALRTYTRASASEWLQVKPEPLWRQYAELRGAREALFGERLEIYFRNYVKHFWMRDWYVDAPDLAVHAQNLMLRVATLRLLLFGHPELAGLEVAAPDERGAALDRVAVATFYAFSRSIDHNTFMNQAASDLPAQLPSVEQAPALLQL